MVTLSQHEQQILAELEAQLTRSRSRLRLLAHRFGSLKSTIQPFALAVGLLLIVLSIFVWWPLAIIGYVVAAFGAVGVFGGSEAPFSRLSRRLITLRDRSEPSTE